MRKIGIFVLSSLLGISVLFGLMGFNSLNGESAFYEPQPVWKNLKVLPQDISKDSLMGLMDNYSISLGVKCSFCHAPQKDDPSKLDFASDAILAKEITRGMITMTNEINENYFKPHFPDPKPKQVHTLNCVMCHHGTANPREYLSNMDKVYQMYKPEKE